MIEPASDAHRYFALVRRDPDRKGFVIQAPDLPDVEERCTTFDEIPRVATDAIRSRLRVLSRQGRSMPEPSPKSAYQGVPEYFDCFLVAVEAAPSSD